MTGRENFLSRWSKRKQAVAGAERDAPVDPETPEIAATEAMAEGAVEGAADEPFDPASLPPLESLTADSDFTPFLRVNVPEGLRNAALRRLWAFDPHLQAPDVLADYAWDFNDPTSVPGFSELTEGTDTQTMLRWIRGEESPPAPAPENTTASGVGTDAGISAEEAVPDDSVADDCAVSDVALQNQQAEIAEQFTNPQRNRRHGGALPN